MLFYSNFIVLFNMDFQVNVKDAAVGPGLSLRFFVGSFNALFLISVGKFNFS